MPELYPDLPPVDADMRGVVAFRKQLEASTREVFEAWTEFSTANVALEKAAVREVGAEADKDNKDFKASLRLFTPPEENETDSFFVCMIPVLQQLQYSD